MPKPLAKITGEQVAEYQVAVWYEAGFEAKELRVTANSSDPDDPTKLPEATYVVCRDAFCERVPLKRYPVGAQIPDGYFLKKLMLQPLAIAAMVGMFLLMFSVDGTLPASVSEPLLSLVGGRKNGVSILVFAVLAHLGEAAFCLQRCTSHPLNQPVHGAIRYAWLTMLIGYPVLRWVNKLHHVAHEHNKKMEQMERMEQEAKERREAKAKEEERERAKKKKKTKEAE